MITVEEYKEDSMPRAKDGDKVKVHFTGKLEGGTIFDSTAGKQPLECVLGKGFLIKGFEESIVGMEPGESRTVTIPSEKAYGDIKKELVLDIEKSKFPSDVEPEVGQQLNIQDEDGHSLLVTITDMSDTHVTIDSNHPLAGKDLTFEIQLVEIL